MAEKSRQDLATILLDVPKTGGRGGGTYIYLLSLLQVPPLNITSVVYTLDPPYSGLMPIKINPGRCS
jgi:hypothetical protein